MIEYWCQAEEEDYDLHTILTLEVYQSFRNAFKAGFLGGGGGGPEGGGSRG